IAAFATAARGLLPGALRDLRSRYPDLSARLSEQEPHQTIPAISRGHLDVAVVQDWADDVLSVPESLSRQDLLDDLFDVALPAAAPARSIFALGRARATARPAIRATLDALRRCCAAGT